MPTTDNTPRCLDCGGYGSAAVRTLDTPTGTYTLTTVTCPACSGTGMAAR
ncbi:hypothetical protein [Thermostaphylospora chromogena]|uniref:Molecular chaperone DnaJ n=1 Tax=Thermostaphylospora chromogena TaxID=35622 RepID=A0A1H1FWS4_9ACTN|nr:hypothetical protein [Thermostaphylospora chromogena]SDR05417.1 hypothetical protein SAMN04489764_3232 [Thermostaphylospora chromogena]SDR23746.1 hypothetical protein SAMN04489764_4341 [Thermostaphylospora chromogena]